MLAREPSREGLTLQQLHDDHRRLVLRFHVVEDLDDVGVLDRACGLRLEHEPGPRLIVRARAQGREQALEGHRAPGNHVRGGPDFAHTPGAQGTIQAVPLTKHETGR